MVELDLAPEDVRLMKEILESALSDLRHEIHSTDARDYREGLKRNKDSLENALKQLEKA